MKKCKVQKCKRPHRGNGFCSYHYNKWYRNKNNAEVVFCTEEARRFFDKRVKVGKQNECWPWEGSVRTNGYGQLQHKGVHSTAHRFSYILHYGKIPYGLLVCHHCDNPICVNPSHLYLGTYKNNADDIVKRNRRDFKTKQYSAITKLSTQLNVPREKIITLLNENKILILDWSHECQSPS
jgi:hypothetical protein